MMIAQYVIVVYLVYAKFFSPILLITLLGLIDDVRSQVTNSGIKVFIPQYFLAFLNPKPTERPKQIPANVWPLYFAPIAFAHNRFSGSLFLLGLVLDAFLF